MINICNLFFKGTQMTSKRKASGIYHELFIDNKSCGYAISLNSADQIKKYSPMPSDMIGDMNVEELSNFITAQALNGNLSEQQAVVVGLASLVSKTPELLQKMPEGGVKSAVMSLLGIGK